MLQHSVQTAARWSSWLFFLLSFNYLTNVLFWLSSHSYTLNRCQIDASANMPTTSKLNIFMTTRHIMKKCGVIGVFDEKQNSEKKSCQVDVVHSLVILFTPSARLRLVDSLNFSSRLEQEHDYIHHTREKKMDLELNNFGSLLNCWHSSSWRKNYDLFRENKMLWSSGNALKLSIEPQD